jgi:hypothetical protein
VFYEIVATARDWALILLALEGIILLAVPLYLLWVITKWAHGFLPKVRHGLRNLHATQIRIVAAAENVMAKIRAPFVWIETNQARVRGFRRAWKQG